MMVRFGLRAKLLVFSSFLFAIPYLGYQYVWELESYLRVGQEQTLVGTARAVATALHERPALFAQESAFVQSVRPGTDLYAHQIKQPIRLDGQLGDWSEYAEHQLQYDGRRLISQQTPYDQQSLNFTHMVGQFGRYLYVMFDVIDDVVIYRNENSLSIHKNDFIQIAMRGELGQFERYVVSPYAAGWVNAYRLASGEDETANEFTRYQPAELAREIQGFWRQTPEGYQVELRFPLAMMQGNIAFAISDVDDAQTKHINYTIGTANPEQFDSLGTVVMTSPEIEQIIQGLEYADARVWVVDKHQRVLARAGDIKSVGQLSLPQKDASAWWSHIQTQYLRPLYYQFLTKPSAEYIDELNDAVELAGQDVLSALNGQADTLWRISQDNKAVIISAAHPIYVAGEVMGAVVVEQTTHGIRTLRNQALEQQFNVYLGVIIFGTLALFLLASRISARIRKLRNDTEQAIDKNGKITGQISVQNSSDEIGDLSRGFAQVLNRLGQYNNYLENMAARLSHELRTPVAVVKSSLENLELVSDKNSAQAKVFVARAKEGLTRLSHILQSMSEATRLENMLENYQKETVDIAQLLTSYIATINLTAPRPVVLTLEKQALMMTASPELFTQMLDKIVANALDFADQDTNVEVVLRQSGSIEVINQGPPIAEEMKDELFNLLVSVREQNDEQLHLGLGLYMAKLIAEFHGLSINASSSKDKGMTKFSIQ